MIPNSDRHNRRILKFPAVHPCEDISPATLLESLISLSRAICSFQPKSFATHRRNARETIRQVSIISILLEEISDSISTPDFSNSVVLCLADLHTTLQKIRFLLADCARDAAKILFLMKSHAVVTQFRALIRAVSTALDVLPFDSIEMSPEIKDLAQMLCKQSRNSRMDIDPEDENTMKRVILILNQFENKIEPDPFTIRRILARLNINSWSECHKEIRFLEDEIRADYSDNNEREIPLLSNLLGFMSYCRVILFEDCDFDNTEISGGRNSSFEGLICLNPEDFRCPISLELMTDPVTVSTGQTYDRSSISKWLRSGNLTCPKTGENLKSLELVPNEALKKLIHKFCEEYGVCLSKSRKKNWDVSRTISPGSPSNSEAIRLVSEFLTVSLGFGSDSQKNKAAHEARLLTKSNLFNRSCLIDSGSIPPLLELLTSTDSKTQENAISTLLKLSKQSKGQKSIASNAGFSLILEVLKNGMKSETKQTAAATIFYLSSSQEQRKIIGGNEETIPSLLELIKTGSSCGKKNSVVAIFGLLFYHKNRERALSAGCVPVLLRLLDSSEKDELKTDTLAVLSALADSFDGSVEICRGLGLSLVLRLLHSIETRAGKEYCVSILLSLCLNCGPDVVCVLAKDGSLMSDLYSLLTEGTSHAGKKSRSLIKILQRFCETRLVRGMRQQCEV